MPQATAKDLSKPFPCQHRQCGCLRADDCWRHCCCFPAGERLAWAQERGIKVPESLVEEAGEASKEPRPCCAAPGGEKKSACNAVKKTPAKTPVLPKKAPGFVGGFMARQCQGMGPLWDGGELAPPQVAWTTWHFDWAASGVVLPTFQFPLIHEFTPPDPPPRG